MFDIHVFHHHLPPSDEDSRPFERIEQQINKLETKIDTYMAKQKDEILAAIAAEREQYLLRIEEALSGTRGWTVADVTEVMTAIRGIVPETSASGRTITLSARSGGTQTLSLTIAAGNVDEEFAQVVLGYFAEAKNGGLSVPSGGSKFDSTLSVSDSQGESDTVKFDNAHQKNSSDVAILEAALVVAKAARDASVPTSLTT